MAITPVGNMQFVAQNAALPSAQASNELAKESFASMANLAEFQAKEKAVEKLEKIAQTEDIKNEVEEKNEEEKNEQGAPERENSGENGSNDSENAQESQSVTNGGRMLDLSI